ncbi:hypothetical protein NAEGRDRAFT_76478 [Naegleria gruberi]|uniref:F-box domain-containing protein n=1 Tax=Naegleria gruberi TaxID=5762 RepID=D2W4Z0_NAEGR|nr:uncharacterized protein NAEGRDRAFT_76478 [Naegleria gruberi]EFC35862.1 hypothetical protein NAEGRDRAFT_76478 [Naegleria gruberi]|eukprot:XP_002668606.1 hypothetical protein NAEGRDRAFT_76478 [Naegleria gruberi strain NEG-M]
MFPFHKRKTQLLDETSLETVDILSLVFQFLELKELFALQKVSPFFYRTIEHLKSLLIRPIYEVGLVSSDKKQLSEFLQLTLKSELISSATKENPQKVSSTRYTYYSTTEIDMTDKNDGNQLKSVKFGEHHMIHAFNKVEKEFVFKNDRFRVFFYPLYCEKSTSLSHDDYQRLDGFIFLNPNSKDGYSTMPNGCSYCATLLDYNNSSVANETVLMPVRNFGSFKVEKVSERYSIEQSILDCINYISENSNRSIQLNSIGDG